MRYMGKVGFVCLKEMKIRSNRLFNGLIITAILGAPPPATLSVFARAIMCTGNASLISDRDSGEPRSAPVLSEARRPRRH